MSSPPLNLGRKKSLGLSTLLSQQSHRILVVSNRLPITVQFNKDATKDEDLFSFKMSSGGLVAGLEGKFLSNIHLIIIQELKRN